jgi:hypothetical protein
VPGDAPPHAAIAVCWLRTLAIFRQPSILRNLIWPLATRLKRRITDSAGQLCDCAYSAVFRFDGELIHWLAARGRRRIKVCG